MKPKEYVTQFALNTDAPDIDGTMNQLRMDFQAQFEFHDMSGNMNITVFNNIEQQIKDKYNSIRNKASAVVLTDELWNTFRKRVCNHVRGLRFRDYYDAKRRSWEERNAEHNAWRREQEDTMRNMFAGMLFGALHARLEQDNIFVRAARIILGIEADTHLTHETIMDAWRAKVRDAHSDKVATASVDEFQTVMKAREILLNEIGDVQ